MQLLPLPCFLHLPRVDWRISPWGNRAKPLFASCTRNSSLKADTGLYSSLCYTSTGLAVERRERWSKTSARFSHLELQSEKQAGKSAGRHSFHLLLVYEAGETGATVPSHPQTREPGLQMTGAFSPASLCQRKICRRSVSWKKQISSEGFQPCCSQVAFLPEPSLLSWEKELQVCTFLVSTWRMAILPVETMSAHGLK